MLAIAVAVLLGQDGGVAGHLTELMIELNGKTDEVAQRFVHARLGALRACYERELARSPQLRGKVTVKAKIMPSERFDAIDVVGEPGNDAVTACITSVVKGWTWPLEIDEPTPFRIVVALEPAAPGVAPNTAPQPVPDAELTITGVELKKGPKAAFEQYVRAHTVVLAACYKHELRRNPAARGTVSVIFEISGGAAAEMRVNQDLQSAAFESCVIDAIRMWHFPFTIADRSPAMFSFAVSPKPKLSLHGEEDEDVRGSGGLLAAQPEAPLRGKLEVKSIERNGKPDEVVTRFVTARLRALQGCYEHELKSTPKLKGTVIVQVVISPSGQTSDLNVSTNFGGSVNDCVANIVRGWTYPFKPDGVERLKIVFTVKPAG